jgi:hypothetical protein
MFFLDFYKISLDYQDSLLSLIRRRLKVNSGNMKDVVLSDMRRRIFHEAAKKIGKISRIPSTAP